MLWFDDLIAKGIISENRDSMSLSYILEYHKLFSLTGYKVLQSQEERGLVHCSKILHNGKDKLVYNISAYKPLNVLMPGLRPDIMLAIVRNLIEVVIVVKNNGFMQFDNVIVTVDKIFIDTNNYKVYLIYLPIYAENSVDSYTAFEYQLKENILKEISLYSNMVTPSIVKMCDAMRNNAVSIEELKELLTDLGSKTSEYGDQSMASYINRSIQNKKVENIQSVQSSEHQQHSLSETVLSNESPMATRKGIFGRFFKSGRSEREQTAEANHIPLDEVEATEIRNPMNRVNTMVLTGMNTPEYCEIFVSKEIFVIGRSTEKVDYAITFNKAVGREHCRLICRDEGWYVEDLNSSNGTFLNGVRLKPKQQTAIKTGDKLRLADSDFRVK